MLISKFQAFLREAVPKDTSVCMVPKWQNQGEKWKIQNSPINSRWKTTIKIKIVNGHSGTQIAEEQLNKQTRKLVFELVRNNIKKIKVWISFHVKENYALRYTSNATDVLKNGEKGSLICWCFITRELMTWVMKIQSVSTTTIYHLINGNLTINTLLCYMQVLSIN